MAICARARAELQHEVNAIIERYGEDGLGAFCETVMKLLSD